MLPDVLTAIVMSLRFPKSMRWGDGTCGLRGRSAGSSRLLGDEVVDLRSEAS